MCFKLECTWILQSWLHRASVMNACGVVSACGSILNTQGTIKQNTLYSWQNFILSSIIVYWCNYFWYHQIIDFCFQSWKTFCLIQTLRTIHAVQDEIFNCCNLILIQHHDFAWAINQVRTLLCNQTCWLYVKFMQHYCNWTIDDSFMWHCHHWTSDCTIEHLIAYALSMQASCDLAWALLCTWTANQYVAIQQQLLSEESFPQLPIYIVLLWSCNSKWSIGI